MIPEQGPGGYPDAQRLDLAEDLSGLPVSDPYRWLEDAGSAAAQDWLRAQDELFRAHGAGLPGVDHLAERILELMGTGHIGVPVWRGARQFFSRRLPGQEHAVLCTADPGPGEPGHGRALIDPAAVDPSGKTTLDSWQPDKEGRLLAYQLSEGGSEESVLRVLDVETGELVDGPIDRCRYTSIAWLPGGKAFYYTRRLPPDAVPDGEEQYHRRVYLHYVGSPADDDVLIFGEGRDKTTYYSASVSRDGRWLMISAARGTEPRNDLWIADLTASGLATPALRPVQEGLDARTGARVGRDGRLYVFTDLDAPRGRLAVTDPADPGVRTWRDLIPADPEAVLEGYAILDGPAAGGEPALLALWTRHAISEISRHDLASGTRAGSVPLPGPGTVGGISERPEGGHEAWFAYTDNTTPATIMHYDTSGGPAAQAQVWARAPGSVQAPPVHAQQVA
ncbi:MAG TPA: S9 family peptidase, partial [Streptosporangiaceae bacterium]|nr:S9 family peptidase [Streptosporangiaceae bacterium]